MCTARSSTIIGGGGSPCGQKDACEIITLSQTSLADGKYFPKNKMMKFGASLGHLFGLLLVTLVST